MFTVHAPTPSPITLSILNVFLIGAALAPYLLPHPAKLFYPYENEAELALDKMNGSIDLIGPTLTGLRDENGVFFVEQRKVDAPILYTGMHVAPAILWSLLMPLQHVSSIRRSYPKLHRFVGYTIALCSAVLTLTGLAFPFLKLAWTDALFSIHSLRIGRQRVPIFAWPSFQFLTHLIGIIMGYTGFQMIVWARRRNFHKHQRWAIFHTYAGYSIHMHRVWTLFYILLGYLLAQLPNEINRWIGVPIDEREKFQAEKQANAWATFMSLLTMTFILCSKSMQVMQDKVKDT